MDNIFGSGVWRKALTKGVYVICGVILINVTDPTLPLYTAAWFLHVWKGCLTLILFTEASYWRDWAAAANGTLGREVQAQANVEIEAIRKLESKEGGK